MTATITFSDGTIIVAEKNSTTYITDEKPEFPEIIDEVTIESEEDNIKLLNAILIECASIDDRYWFTFVEKSTEQVEKEELLADIEAQAKAIQELAEIIGGMEG